MKSADIDKLEQLLRLLANDAEAQTAEKRTDFNIFKVLRVEKKEVIICRLLGELLNPNGTHDMGAVPLQLFAKVVLKTPLATADFENASIELEERIDGDRRVDIVIRTNQKIFPLEVKIDAGDQPQQLYDYYHHYFNNDFSQKIYYLTLAGKAPAEISVTSKNGLKLQGTCVSRISFRKEILLWLIELKKHNEQRYLNMILDQFRETIEEMTEFNMIEELLGLHDETSEKDDLQEAAITLLRNSDELMRSIRRNHLMRYLEKVNGYQYLPVNGDAIDRHALLAVTRDGEKKPVAWICVDTNVYLCCAARKEQAHFLEGKDSYYWQYISPDGLTKKFNMKEYKRILKDGDVIRIKELLEEIKE